MDTWDNALPEMPDRDRPSRDRPSAGRSAEDGGSAKTEPELPDLRLTLQRIADEAVAASPCGELFPQVMARAARIRRRRRMVRASSAVAVLVAVAVLGPSVASELGMHGGDASAAPPPSAIVDLTSAYPEPNAYPVPNASSAASDGAPVAEAMVPENALAWPSRGAVVPAQAVEVAKSYLSGTGLGAKAGGLVAAGPATSAGPTATATTTTTATTVTPLWAQVDSVSANGHKTWLYVMEGWTTGSDGMPSPAQLLVGDYTQAGKAASMSVYATRITFAHARPGSGDDSDDAEQIAELSLWLPQSGRLVVLGAPQTETVLYASTGGDLIPQKTTDGVAVFPRTERLVKGHFADTIQVRDANNVALTPPKAWSAGDFELSGAESFWSSASRAWVMVPGRGGVGPGPGAVTGTGPEPGVPVVTPSGVSGSKPSATSGPAAMLY